APGLPADGPLQLVAAAGVLLLGVGGAPGRLQDVAELVELDGLEEVVVGAGGQALAGGLGGVPGGPDDDADVGAALADLPDQPQPAAPRHAQVGHHHRGQAALQQVKGLLGRAGRLALVAPGAGWNEGRTPWTSRRPAPLPEASWRPAPCRASRR